MQSIRMCLWMCIEHVQANHVFIQAGSCQVWGLGSTDACWGLRPAGNYQ